MLANTGGYKACTPNQPHAGKATCTYYSTPSEKKWLGKTDLNCSFMYDTNNQAAKKTTLKQALQRLATKS